MPEISLLLLAGVFLTALLYASVGHGGASGYLAVLSLGAFSPNEMASGALLLNLMVAGMALAAYARGGYFSARLAAPFLAASIPAAYLGGRMEVSFRLYGALLIGALLFSAWRLWLRAREEEGLPARPPRLAAALPAGAGIGLLSGVVGVGGGIFLSPMMLLFRWAGARQTAAVSAAFILANSGAGIAGRMAVGQFQPALAGPLAGAAFCGGLAGATLGASRLSGFGLRRVLAVVLLAAVAKMAMRMAWG